jgi:predicted phage baseplate assembly protein
LLEADPDEAAFTVDPVRYSVTLDCGPGQTPVLDYDGDNGTTLRLGDGVFGRRPAEGMLFRVLYRAGGSAIGNVAADTITGLDPSSFGGPVLSVTNPFAALGGADAEPDDRVRELAPFAFRAKQFRAVRREDYDRQAAALPWVQRAGTAFRWTGSWLTVFTTVEPLGAVGLTNARSLELVRLLNRVRMAGYEAYAPPPRYAPLDLQVFVCAKADAFRAEVRAALLDALGPAVSPGGRKGFFHPDHFSFGDPLELSALEAAAQAVPGVAGVIEVRYRRRGFTKDYIPMPLTVDVGIGAVVLVENDPNRPDRGSLRVYVEGGR